MIVNQFMFTNNASISQFISKANYFYFEVINFSFICMHNLILLVHYYKSWTLDIQSYETLDSTEFNNVLHNNNWLLSIIQIIYLIFVLIIWYKFNFIQCYFNNLQLQYESKKPLIQRLKQYRELYHAKNPNFYLALNENLNMYLIQQKLK